MGKPCRGGRLTFHSFLAMRAVPGGSSWPRAVTNFRTATCLSSSFRDRKSCVSHTAGPSYTHLKMLPRKRLLFTRPKNNVNHELACPTDSPMIPHRSGWPSPSFETISLVVPSLVGHRSEHESWYVRLHHDSASGSSSAPVASFSACSFALLTCYSAFVWKLKGLPAIECSKGKDAVSLSHPSMRRDSARGHKGSVEADRTAIHTASTASFA